MLNLWKNKLIYLVEADVGGKAWSYCIFMERAAPFFSPWLKREGVKDIAKER